MSGSLQCFIGFKQNQDYLPPPSFQIRNRSGALLLFEMNRTDHYGIPKQGGTGERPKQKIDD